MTRTRIVLALFITAIAVSTALAGSDWAGFRGPLGTGETADLPPGDGALALKVMWKRTLGSAYAGISIAGDTLVVAGAEGERDYIFALDPATGKERWRYDLAPAYRGHDGSHDGVISTPAIAGGRVFALSPTGQLAAIDVKTGKGLWRVHLVDDLGSEAPYYGFGSSPLVVGKTMVVQIGGEAGSVAGFDVETGEVRWRAVKDEIATQSPMPAVLAGRQQVVVLGSTKVAGLDPADGTVLWEMEHEGGRGYNAFSSPVPLQGDRIFLQHGGDSTGVVGVAVKDDLLVPEMQGTSRWLSKSYSPPARAGQNLYGYTGRTLTAFDPVSREMLWRSREPGDGFLIAVGDQLAVLTKTGSLHLGPANPEGWQEHDQIQLFEDLAWTPPSSANGVIYARSLGEIAAVKLVRVSELVAEGTGQGLPAALQPLAAGIAAADDPGKVLDEYLAERELPLVDGEQVVFLWRGEAEDVAIGGEMIGMRRDEPMHRLAGTDLWWWATELDRHARISYLFFVDYEPTTDPANERTTQSTVIGPDMNWNRGEPMQMSWFAMPEWPGLKYTDAPPAATGDPQGRSESFKLNVQPAAPDEGDKPEPVEVPVDVWLPPGYDEGSESYPVIYIGDTGPLEIGAWPDTLNRVVGRTVVPLILVVLDVPRMPGLDDALAEQIVPAIDARYRTLTDREHRALVGMGWSGIGAAVTTFSNPELFGILGVQSFYAVDEPMAEFRQAVGEANASTLPMRIYLEWGRWDLISPHENMNMRQWSRAAWDLLRERGWKPMGGEVWDSTDWGSWRNRTDVMLESLFPMEGVEVEMARWQTERR